MIDDIAVDLAYSSIKNVDYNFLLNLVLHILSTCFLLFISSNKLKIHQTDRDLEIINNKFCKEDSG